MFRSRGQKNMFYAYTRCFLYVLPYIVHACCRSMLREPKWVVYAILRLSHKVLGRLIRHSIGFLQPWLCHWQIRWSGAVFLVSLEMSSFPARHEVSGKRINQIFASYELRLPACFQPDKNTASGHYKHFHKFQGVLIRISLYLYFIII